MSTCKAVTHTFTALIVLSALILSAFAQQSETTEAKPHAAPPASANEAALPKVPEGFTIQVFAKAPDFHSPVSLAATPDGKVFIGEDEYNSQPDRKMGLSHIKLCVDSDSDGRADKITTFADQINSPQGMCCVGDTLYVVHAPLLTALRDTDGDGVADVRENLVTGLGPVPEDLVHHIPSGVHFGVDGWLYIAVGDKGIKEATGKDGRKITLHGGGVVRVRPDGTGLHVFCSGTRNIFDVALDPYLNAFTRDNTNDGGGWNVRLSQMQRDAIYGYPNLFKNYAEEIIPCIEDYGAGGPTGSIWLHEPGFPGRYGDSLYSTDWAKSVVYRHETRPAGATFKVNSEEFLKGGFVTHLDVDGCGRIFVADWARRDWGNNNTSGIVYLVRFDPSKAGPTSQPIGTPSKRFPEMASASLDQLVEYLASPSAVCRREAQWQWLKRGSWPGGNAALVALMRRPDAPLYARVAALFTLSRVGGAAAESALVEAATQDSTLREFALRALADAPDDAKVSPGAEQLFVSSLNDPNPRVRVQAAIGIGHLGEPGLAAALIPITADADIMVRHAAQQSIRRLNAIDACLVALATPGTPPEIVDGVLRTMRSMHDPRVVATVASFLDRTRRPELRRDAIKTLGRLYQLEAPWDGVWWRTVPDTRGPNYKGVDWDKSGAVAELLIKLINDPDVETAKPAIAQAGNCRMPEAAPVLAKLVQTDGPLRKDAAKAVIDMKSNRAESLAALQYIMTVPGDVFDADTRGNAAAALGGIDGPEARAAVLQLVTRLDTAENPNPTMLEKACEGLAAKPATAPELDALLGILAGNQRSAEVAAAASLLRSSDQPVKDRVAGLWKSAPAKQLDALLTGLSRLPVAASKEYEPPVRELLASKDQAVRHAAIAALGHVARDSSIADLLAAAKKEVDRVPAAKALATINPSRAADDQVLPVATILAKTAAELNKGTDRESYAKLLAAAQKYAEDKRVPKDEAAKLLSQLHQTGVIYAYRRTDPIPAGGAAESFKTAFPPETTPGGPFTPFEVDGKTYDWKDATATDPRGVLTIDAPPSSAMYLTTTIDAPAAGTAELSCGSDDGIHVWVNGKPVHANDIDRGCLPDTDKVAVALEKGPNVLLLKVNNRTGPCGVEARVRSRVAEFQPDEIVPAVQKLSSNPARGKELFTSLGCVKCHTTDPHEEPKGPFLGGIGSKYDAGYFAESIMRPSAKIAQGFGSTLIKARDENGKRTTEYSGFIVKEEGDQVQLRDLTGRVTTIAKDRILSRQALPGSMMPEGLVDPLTLDDFRALLSYLESLKDQK